MRYLRNYTPTPFAAPGSRYDPALADSAVAFINCLRHTKGEWYGKHFELIDWQEQIVRDLFGIVKPTGYRQFNTAFVEIAKKQGKSELAAAIALLLTCGDGEHGGEVYGCASDRQQASIVFDVACGMVDDQRAVRAAGHVQAELRRAAQLHLAQCARVHQPQPARARLVQQRPELPGLEPGQVDDAVVVGVAVGAGIAARPVERIHLPQQPHLRRRVVAAVAQRIQLPPAQPACHPAAVLAGPDQPGQQPPLRPALRLALPGGPPLVAGQRQLDGQRRPARPGDAARLLAQQRVQRAVPRHRLIRARRAG
ncbi:MAG: terminase large subunit [Nocardiopsaceae bacterium]|nr:terminase large subunit [Nocardiopsaceae bacterium]